jgi:hypothetical protein
MKSLTHEGADRAGKSSYDGLGMDLNTIDGSQALRSTIANQWIIGWTLEGMGLLGNFFLTGFFNAG